MHGICGSEPDSGADGRHTRGVSIYFGTAARARQRHRAVVRVRAEVAAGTLSTTAAEESLKPAGVSEVKRTASAPESGMFVVPLARCVHPTEPSMNPRSMSPDDYLLMVDLTGRLVRPGKRGAIDPRLPALLTRLDLKLDAWIATMSGWRQMHGSGVGVYASRVDHAADKGVRWLRNRCGLFAA